MSGSLRDASERAWRNLPPREAVYAFASPEILVALRAHRERTGVGPARLLKNRDDLPSGMTIRGLAAFIHGECMRIRRHYLDYALALWEELPDQNLVTLTPEIRETLRAHMARTGKGAAAVLRGARDKPEGLGAQQILDWLHGKLRARRDHLQYVLSLYEQPPDRGTSSHVRVTLSIRAELTRLMRRTAVSPETLLPEAPDAAQRLRDAMEGKARLASRVELDRALDRWRGLLDRRGLPLRKKLAPTKHERTALTDAVRHALRANWMRVGLSIEAFVAALEDPPPGITGGQIHRWITDHALRTARKDHLEFVLAAWSRLPAGMGRLSRIHLIPFAQD